MLSFPPGQVCPGYHSAAFLVCLFSGGRMYSGFTVLNMAVVVLVLLWDRLALEMCNALHGCLGLLLQLQGRKTELIRKCDWIHVSVIYFVTKYLNEKTEKYLIISLQPRVPVISQVSLYRKSGPGIHLKGQSLCSESITQSGISWLTGLNKRQV